MATAEHDWVARSGLPEAEPLPAIRARTFASIRSFMPFKGAGRARGSSNYRLRLADHGRGGRTARAITSLSYPPVVIPTVWRSNRTTRRYSRAEKLRADDNFLMKLTSTGVFVYDSYLVIVMADDSPIFEGRVPFRWNRFTTSSSDCCIRPRCTEGHEASTCCRFERRINNLVRTSICSTCSRSRRAGLYREPPRRALERMRTLRKLGFDSRQMAILEDLIIENQQCYRRAEIHTQVLSNPMAGFHREP